MNSHHETEIDAVKRRKQVQKAAENARDNNEVKCLYTYTCKQLQKAAHIASDNVKFIWIYICINIHICQFYIGISLHIYIQIEIFIDIYKLI